MNKYKKMKHYHPKLPVLILVILTLIGGIYWLGWHHGEHEKEEAKFLVTKPWRQTLNISNAYVAQIHAIQHIEFRSFERGYLQNIYVDEGQLVHKGQEIFQLMPLLMQAEFEKAKAEYELTKIEFDNTERLQQRKVVSDNELALAKARLDKAAAEMKLAQTHLSLTTIKAPFDGIIDRFHVRLGSLVGEGELLTTLSDNSKMWVYFNVSEADYLDFMSRSEEARHAKVSLMLANNKKFKHSGHIDTIEADFNNETGNVAFRATFPNPEGLLRHGETGTVLLNEMLENALVVPQKATFEVLDKKYVYVVDKHHKLHSREIVVAEEVPHLFVVTSGLKEDEMILLEGLGKVHNGEAIAIDLQAKPDVLASLNLSVE